MLANAQQLPHDPWFLILVTAFFSVQSKLVGAPNLNGEEITNGDDVASGINCNVLNAK
jgi:hypothetical protein